MLARYVIADWDAARTWGLVHWPAALVGMIFDRNLQVNTVHHIALTYDFESLVRDSE